MIKTRTVTGIALLTVAFAVAACGRDNAPESGVATEERASDAAGHPASDLRTLLASENRAEADRLRDAGRRPADVIEFLGIEKGMRVMDVMAAGGYYTEVLSLAVGEHGQVVSQNPPAFLKYRDGAYEKALSARLADDRLPNVTRLNKDFADFTPDDGPFDAAITALNFHDLYGDKGMEATTNDLRSILSVLKPGGVLGIIDHVGEAGEDNVALHRIEIAKVLECIDAAGFVVDSDSDLLRNEADDHTLTVFDAAVRGKTDRFLLKLRKPVD